MGSDVAVASAHSSIKSLSGNSSGTELAARYCFVLEDPPDEKKEDNKKEATNCERYVIYMESLHFCSSVTSSIVVDWDLQCCV